MHFTRRTALALGSAALAAGALPARLSAMTLAEDAIMEFTGGVTPGEGGIDLTTPEIAENGNTVPVSVSAPGAAAIAIFAAGNPEPRPSRPSRSARWPPRRKPRPASGSQRPKMSSPWRKWRMAASCRPRTS